MRKRIAVLASGGGTNLQALIDHLQALGDSRSADVVFVGSDRAGAGALRRAAAHGIPAMALDATRRDAALLDALRAARIDIVALAGYLRFVPTEVTTAFHGRIVNVHPALLPAFGGAGMYGERVHAAVIASGARVSGATVHFVDSAYDHGAIVAQWPVVVAERDSAQELAHRVLAVEHLLYPRVVNALAAGHIRLSAGGQVAGWNPVVAGWAFVVGHEEAIARAIDAALEPL
jgi:phosphoribosylglycinamide formyltransferase 1